MARGLKFFGTRTGGIMETTKDVPDAELFASDDWAGLTDAIARWIKQGHPQPAGAAALMRQRLHPEVFARKHFEIYRELLSANAHRRSPA